MGNVHVEHIVINSYTCLIFAAEYGFMVRVFLKLFMHILKLYISFKNSFNFVFSFTDQKRYWLMMKPQCMCMPLMNIKKKERNALFHSINNKCTQIISLICCVCLNNLIKFFWIEFKMKNIIIKSYMDFMKEDYTQEVVN